MFSNVDIVCLSGVGRVKTGLAAIARFLEISDIIESFYHDKSSSISKLINPKLGRRGGSSPPPTCWFSLNKSEMVKAVTLVFSCIQQHCIRDICVKSNIDNLPQSLVTGQNSDGGISEYGISGQSLIKENCHKSRTSDNIDMKIGSVTKLGTKNKTTSNIFDNDVMSGNCDVIIKFPIYGQFGATGSRIPDA